MVKNKLTALNFKKENFFSNVTLLIHILCVFHALKMVFNNTWTWPNKIHGANSERYLKKKGRNSFGIKL